MKKYIGYWQAARGMHPIVPSECVPLSGKRSSLIAWLSRLQFAGQPVRQTILKAALCSFCLCNCAMRWHYYACSVSCSCWAYSCLGVATGMLSLLALPVLCKYTSCMIKKHKLLSAEEKLAIVDAVLTVGKDVAARFHSTASTLSTIFSLRESIHNAVESGTSCMKKRLKPSTYADTDKAVFTLFLDTSIKCAYNWRDPAAKS